VSGIRWLCLWILFLVGRRIRTGVLGEMPIKGVHIETLCPPTRYSQEEIERACQVAWWLQRGKLTLCVPPDCDDEPGGDE
jgi:hypothetical protein